MQEVDKKTPGCVRDNNIYIFFKEHDREPREDT